MHNTDTARSSPMGYDCDNSSRHWNRRKRLISLWRELPLGLWNGVGQAASSPQRDTVPLVPRGRCRGATRSSIEHRPRGGVPASAWARSGRSMGMGTAVLAISKRDRPVAGENPVRGPKSDVCLRGTYGRWLTTLYGRIVHNVQSQQGLYVACVEIMVQQWPNKYLPGGCSEAVFSFKPSVKGNISTATTV